MFDTNDEEMLREDIEQEDLDEFDDPEVEEVEAFGKEKIKNLKAHLTECEEGRRAILEDLQRAKADFLNARKRLEEERTRDQERSAREFAERLLPLCDSIDLAILHSTEHKEDSSWRQGIQGIKQQLNTILASYGIRAVDPTGSAFDPNKHEAVANIPVTDEAQNNIVVAVLQAGYERTTQERVEVVRPARVSVGTYSRQ